MRVRVHRFKLLLLGLSALCSTVAGCYAPPAQKDEPPVVVIDATDTDIAFDADVIATVDDAEPDSTVDVSTDASSDGSMNFDESLWHLPNPCEGKVTFPEDNSPFEMPDRPPEHDHYFTKQGIIETYGELPLQGFIVAPAPNLQPGEGRTFSMFSEPGTDATFYVYVINNYNTDVLESFRLNMTAMVDYEPVEASYERWDPSREHILFDKTKPGINYPIESDVEIIDVTIPGDVFDEERMYEISLNMESTTIERRSVGLSRRFALYNGGYNRPNRPCVEPRLDEELLEIEFELFGRISDDVGILFFEGIEHRDQLREVIDVAPNETKRLFLTILRATSVPRPTVLVPLMAGEPVADPWWVTQGGEIVWPRGHVEARKTFEVTFPAEPGIYEVQVASWVNPFELAKDREGNNVEGVRSSELNENSNTLRFRVTE